MIDTRRLIALIDLALLESDKLAASSKFYHAEREPINVQMAISMKRLL
jgi:hypothetical protein